MKRRAFTLLELLMVIMILGLLVAILIPGIVAAMRLARRVQCANNLGWVGKQLHNYASDHGGVLPTRHDPKGVYADPQSVNDWNDTWFYNLFQTYVTDPKVLFCPDSSDALSAPGGKWSANWDRHITYAILDGFPAGASGTAQDPSGNWLGGHDSPASWNLTGDMDSTGTPQGFLGAQNLLDANGNTIPGTIESLDINGNPVLDNNGQPQMMSVPSVKFSVFRPNWSKAESTNSPIMGDLVVERAGSAWSISHGTMQTGDPLGMNILYADCHASWATQDTPVALPCVDPNIRNEQRLWRRIYAQADGSYVRFLIRPTDLKMGDTRQ
jgi:prepilin-type N-terminal cleavage/methylation domain-containing protein/prepilin-type processing-associated H-X9-DG protein